MITVRAGPRMSVIAGPICRTQYMFMKMCSSEACSQPALSTVHQRPNVNTGTAPLAPNRNSTGVLGASIDMMPPIRIALPDISSVIAYSVTQAPMTSGREAEVGAEPAASDRSPTARDSSGRTSSTCRRARRRAIRTTDRRPSRWFGA